MISRLNSAILDSKCPILSSIRISIESTFFTFQRPGVRLSAISYFIQPRRPRQLFSISLSSISQSTLCCLKKTRLIAFWSSSLTNSYSRRSIFPKKQDQLWVLMSHSVNVRSLLFSRWASNCCLVARQHSNRWILVLIRSSLGRERSASRLQIRSSTAEWQVCSCWVSWLLIFLESCCSVNSQTKFIFQLQMKQIKERRGLDSGKDDLLSDVGFRVWRKEGGERILHSANDKGK